MDVGLAVMGELPRKACSSAARDIRVKPFCGLVEYFSMYLLQTLGGYRSKSDQHCCPGWSFYSQTRIKFRILNAWLMHVDSRSTQQVQQAGTVG